MTDENRLTRDDWQKAAAVGLYTFAMGLLESDDPEPEEAEVMMHAAHAARYHWTALGSILNVVRCEWQLSRVYETLDRSEPSLFHARRCLALCRKNGIGGLDLAFAYEGMARAAASAGLEDLRDEALGLAREAGEALEEPEKRKAFFAHLSGVPGF